MRTRRVRVADALHDGRVPVVHQPAHVLQPRIQADIATGHRHRVVPGDGDGRTHLEIAIVPEGNNGIQPVIAAEHAKDDDNPAVGRGHTLG